MIGRDLRDTAQGPLQSAFRPDGPEHGDGPPALTRAVRDRPIGALGHGGRGRAGRNDHDPLGSGDASDHQTGRVRAGHEHRRRELDQTGEDPTAGPDRAAAARADARAWEWTGRATAGRARARASHPARRTTVLVVLDQHRVDATLGEDPRRPAVVAQPVLGDDRRHLVRVLEAVPVDRDDTQLMVGGELADQRRRRAGQVMPAWCVGRNQAQSHTRLLRVESDPLLPKPEEVQDQS